MGYCDKLKKGKNMTEKKSYKENFTPEERERYWERLYKDAEEDVLKKDRKIEKLERQLYLAQFERDEWKKLFEKCTETRDGWKKLYEHTLSIAEQATDHE